VIRIPAGLQPLLARPPNWPIAGAWRVFAAACRASGVVAWAARLEGPDGEVTWFQGRTASRPGIIQSECVDALTAALRAVPEGDAVEVIAPTSLRYLVEGAAFPDGTPERCLWELARTRRAWPRYALGDLEAPVAQCLKRAYTELAPLRWPGEAALGSRYVVYADGGCTPESCASAWVLRQSGQTLAEHAWCLPGPIEPDAVRRAEFLAATEGLAAAPPGSQVAVVTDHADVTDFGVRGVAAFRPSRSVAPILQDLRRRGAERQVTWYWAARQETGGQRRCQLLIDRQQQAATAWRRFARACLAAGVRRVCAPAFDQWLAPREPLVDQPGEDWSATFERRDRYLAAEGASPRVYVRQLRLDRATGLSMACAFARSALR
jgi:ribonuclease HI